MAAKVVLDLGRVGLLIQLHEILFQTEYLKWYMGVLGTFGVKPLSGGRFIIAQ